MKCPKCQHEVAVGAKFCSECGSKLQMPCPRCRNANPAGSKFCHECGHDLRLTKETSPVNYSEPESYTPKFLADKILTTRSSIKGERKLVTVFFADVANYTAFSEKLDPEEVHQIMDGCFKILMDEIHRYEGTINQFTGDGVMALFGAPLAHEDHAQRACHAALSIQKTLEKYGQKIKQDYGLDFKMRIGLNSGPVVVASIGDDLRMDYTAVGDTTNLAARMESKAEPGRILLSEATHKLVKDFFEFNPLGKVEVKGKEQPQETYELLKISDIETRISASVAKGLTKFVGRKNSMAALKEVFARVISGSGQVVGIVGEAGVGKSRLLFEFVKQLPQGEATYLEGRCLHFGSGMVYLPILDMVRAYFEIREGDPESVIKEKLFKKIRQLDEGLSDTLPSFQELLSVKVDDEKYMQLDPGHKKMRTFEAIRNLFIRVSERQPLVLAIEDLHWIDKTSEGCISYLIDWLANTRIMLILLYRLEYTHQWGSKSYYTKIGLTQLGDVSSRLLVQAILQEEQVPPEIRYQVLSRAGGNPLFVEELTQSLLESGTIVRKGHEYRLTRDLSEIQVPDTIQGIIAARIDGIEESMKHVIQVAAVVGREFAFRILQSIIEMKKDLKSHLLNLQGLEFISQKRLFPELEYIFKHALIQEVAYNSLLQKRRKELHEKIGIAIESLYPDRLEEYYELLAYHFTRSDNKDKALEYLDLANQKAIKANAVEEAKNYFEEAIKLIDILPETPSNQRRLISMLVNQQPVYMLLLQYSEYYEYLTRYESTAIGLEDPGFLGAYYGRVGNCEFSFGNFKRALKTSSKASELCNIAKNPIQPAPFTQLAWDHLYLGDFRQVLIFKDLTMRAMERQFNLRTCSWALQAASWAYSYMGQWDQAVKEGEEAVRIAEEFSDNSVASFSAWILCLAYTYKGDLSRALEYGEMAVKRAPTPADRAWAQTSHAFALGRAGEIDKAIAILANLIPVYRAANWVPGAPTMLFLVEGYIQAGEYDKATQTLDELMEIAKRCEMRFMLGSGYRLAGEISGKTNPEDSAGFFEKSIALLKEINAKNELAMAYAGYGRLHKQQGNVIEAKEFLTKALEIFEHLGTLIEPDRVREELAGLSEP